MNQVDDQDQKCSSTASDVSADDSAMFKTVRYLIRQGNRRALLAALNAGPGAEVDASNCNTVTPLMYAAKKGRLDIVLSLIKEGADVRRRSLHGMTVAHFAAQYGHVAALLTALDGGVEVDATESRGVTPLMCAAMNGHVNCALLLIRRGANVRLQSKDGMGAVHFAARHGRRKVLLALIDAGAEVDVIDSLEMTPLLYAMRQCHLNCMLALIQQGADVRARAKDGSTSAHIAAQNGSNETLLAILDALDADPRIPLSADLNAWDKAEMTPLMHAARGGHLDCVVSLMQRGADVRVASNGGLTAADCAADRGHTEVLLALLGGGAAVDIKQSNSLVHAARNGHLECMRLLVQCGADARKTLSFTRGWTAAHLAANYGHVEAMRVLLECDVDMMSRADGTSIVDWAAVEGEVAATSFALACGSQFASPCNKFFGEWNRVSRLFWHSTVTPTVGGFYPHGYAL